MTTDRAIDPSDEPVGADARRLPGAPDAGRDPVGRPADQELSDAAPTAPQAARHPGNRSEIQDPSNAVEEPLREDETTEPG